MVVNNITEQIKTLGFSEYEAKAYIYLLKIQPATAYELSQESGIPSSKIYEIIARLVEKNVFMLAIEKGRKKKYSALPPKEFIDSRRSFFDKTLNNLESTLPSINKAFHVSCIWNFTEYAFLLDKAERMINEAKNTILLSVWDKELGFLERNLVEAESKNIKIATVHFGSPENSVGQCFQHPIENTIYKEKGGRGFTLVCDSKNALVATINDKTGVEGAWSSNHGFITLAEDYIKHDIYIMKIVDRFKETLLQTFGENYKHLRDIFEDRDIK